ncbi:MAG: zinc finger domain-containing protein [Bacillota bacterium]|uniref:zinc finger domain-containing protein n=1 Tax=Desulfurispora thermophila TaxID=265470 RepID=UPI00036F8131|nr:zinc finger domain-containing protein [Desulfurispora thermophila]
MYYPGEIKTPGLELMLVLVRVIYFVALVLTTAGAGMVAGLPPVVSGTIGGLFGFFLLACGHLFEVVNVTCPHCGHRTRSLRDYGSFLCPNCQQVSIVKEGKANKQ